MDDITLEWFFKLPGLFITAGVLLILIALIVFIIGSRKEKKNKNDTNYNIDSDQNEQNSVVEPIPSIVQNNEPTNFIGGVPVNNEINNIEMKKEDNVISVNTPEIVPIEEVKVEPIVNSVPEITPVPEVKVEPVVNPVPEITPQVSEVNKPENIEEI